MSLSFSGILYIQTGLIKICYLRFYKRQINKRRYNIFMGNSNRGQKFVEEKGTAKCGCYIRRPDAVGVKFDKAIVPLKSIDYRIDILNSLANITLVQTYQNPISSFLEVDYSLPINSESSIYKFEVEFNNVKIEGVVREKEQAKKIHEKAKSEGRQTVIGTIDPDSKDIFNIEIGNIPPKTKFIITLSFLQEMKVGTSTFYQLKIPSAISPRYMNQVDGVVKVPEHMQKDGQSSGPADYKWNFTINVKTTKRVVFFDSPSHNIILKNQNQSGTQTLLEMEKSQVPNKDFEFVYTTEDFQVPSFVVGKTDTTSTVMLSFLPKFCNMDVTDAYKAYIENTTYDVDMDKAKGDYVFFLDRSGSMGGTRIQQAKKALILFLKSLPEDSYFNIISFGSSSQRIFQKSEKLDFSKIEVAIKQVQLMDADMGGTEIYHPLETLLKEKVIEGYPRHVFLLTDGDVSDTEGVIRMVAKSTKYSRVHTIGIGSGASQSLIQGCSKAGKGKSIMVSDDENPAEKIIGLLESALTPVISKVDLKCSSLEQVQSIIPNPHSIPYILKDEILNFFITFNNEIPKNTKFTFSYEDPLTKAPYTSELTLNETVLNQPFVDRMSHLKVLKQLQNSAREGVSIQDHMHYVKVKDYKQQAIKYSVKHQVLSQYTAFICVGKQLVDGQYHQFKDLGVEKVWVEQPKINYAEESRSMPFAAALGGMSMNRKMAMPPPTFANFMSAPQRSMAMKCEAPQIMMDLCEDIDIPMAIQNCSMPIQKNKRAYQNKMMLIEKEQSQESKPKPIKPQDLLTQIIQSQNPNGSWTNKDLLNKISKNPQQTIQLSTKINHEIVITKLVIVWMQKNHPGKEYALILKKAQAWLKKKVAEEGVDESKLGQIESV